MKLPPWLRPSPPPLIIGDKLDFNALSPELAAILKAIIGKLDREDLGDLERAQVKALYQKLDGPTYRIVTRGMFDTYGAPVEHIKGLPPDPRRK
jgi:hypothetical protein